MPSLRILDWARNVVSGGKKLKAPKKEARFLSYEEAAKFFKAVNTQGYGLWLDWVCLQAGEGEILNLKWRDIDFEGRFIRVVNRPDEGFQTKNYRNRTVGLHKDLKKIFLWWRNTCSARVRFQ